MKTYKPYNQNLLSHTLSFKEFTPLNEEEQRRVTEERRKLFEEKESPLDVLKSEVLYKLLFNKKVKKLGNLKIQHYDGYVVVDRGTSEKNDENDY
jgi:hypothetical protein